jgi:hypothetical protein
MRWLNYLFRPPAPTTADPSKEVEAKTFKGRARRVDIVGEGHYDRALAKIAGPKAANGVNMYTVARLVPEPANRHDRNAVAAIIDGHIVGYLSRQQAINFQRAMKERGFGGFSLTGCRAHIDAGWLRFSDLFGRDEGNYRVTLLIPESIAKEIGFGKPWS